MAARADCARRANVAGDCGVSRRRRAARLCDHAPKERKPSQEPSAGTHGGPEEHPQRPRPAVRRPRVRGEARLGREQSVQARRAAARRNARRRRHPLPQPRGGRGAVPSGSRRRPRLHRASAAPPGPRYPISASRGPLPRRTPAHSRRRSRRSRGAASAVARSASRRAALDGCGGGALHQNAARGTPERNAVGVPSPCRWETGHSADSMASLFAVELSSKLDTLRQQQPRHCAGSVSDETPKTVGCFAHER